MHENSFCADPACAQGACECRGGVLGPDYHNRLASGFSVGVPGVPAAVDRMLKERGTFSLARATAPAIARARSGFPMYEHLHEKIVSSAVRLQHFPGVCVRVCVSVCLSSLSLSLSVCMAQTCDRARTRMKREADASACTYDDDN